MFVRKLLVLACLAAPLTLVSAQPPSKDAAPSKQPAPAAKLDFPPLTGGELKLDPKEIPTAAEVQRVTRFANSTDPETVATAADKPLLDKIAKYYLYRLTWEEVQEARNPESTGTIPSIMNDIVGGTEVVTRYRVLPRVDTRTGGDEDVQAQRTRQIAYVQLIAPSLLTHAREVLQSQAIIARVNAARVLARLAEFGQEAAVDDLVRIIRHPQEHNAVRHWAFVGLEDIFNLVGSNEPRARGVLQSKTGAERATTALTAVYEWLDASTKVPELQQQAMQPAGVAGLRYVRRSAVRALGAGRRPMIVDDRANNKQAGPVADVLTRIASGDGTIAPAPDLRERYEAALALAQLQASLSPSYQADYAAFQIANVLVALGTEANAGRDIFSWPYEAYRIRTALNNYPRRAGSAASSYVQNFVTATQPLVEYLDNRQVNTDAVKRLADWMRDNRPTSTSVYKALGQ